MAAKKQPHKKKKNNYFTHVHQDAILEYTASEDPKHRNELYRYIIRPAFKEMINTKFIDRINDAIPNTLVIDYFPDINLPDNPLKRLAMGGVSGGGRTLVGERGPEVLTLPKGSRVEPNHGAGMNAGGNVTVNVSTNAIRLLSAARLLGGLAWGVSDGSRRFGR